MLQAAEHLGDLIVLYRPIGLFWRKNEAKNTIEKKPEQFKPTTPYEPTSTDEEGKFFISKFEKVDFSAHFDPFSHRNLGARSARERKFEHFHRFCVGSFSLPTWPFAAINTPLESPCREGEEEREKGRRERGSLGRISSSKARCSRGQNWCRTNHGIDRSRTH